MGEGRSVRIGARTRERGILGEQIPGQRRHQASATRRPRMYPVSYVTGWLHVLGHRPNLQIPVPPPRPTSAEQGYGLGGEGGISCGCDAGRGRQLSTRAHSLTADHTHWLRARQREDRRPNEERSGEQGRARVERGQQRFSQPPTAEPAGDVRLASVQSRENFKKNACGSVPAMVRVEAVFFFCQLSGGDSFVLVVESSESGLFLSDFDVRGPFAFAFVPVDPDAS
jgi:hypothetical protein